MHAVKVTTTSGSIVVSHAVQATQRTKYKKKYVDKISWLKVKLERIQQDKLEVTDKVSWLFLPAILNLFSGIKGKWNMFSHEVMPFYLVIDWLMKNMDWEFLAYFDDYFKIMKELNICQQRAKHTKNMTLTMKQES